MHAAEEHCSAALFFFMKRAIFLLLLLICGQVHAQQYPRWFLFPAEVRCPTSISVITQPPTFYKDSAIAEGFRLGCEVLARHAMMQISGGQAFWATEAGIHSMGAEYKQYYDTSLTDVYRRTLKVLDSYIDKQKTLVLVGDSSCRVDGKVRLLIKISSIPQPTWVEQLPEDAQYNYAVGFSEEFYYETSSWQRAEKNAYMALARSIQVKMKSMQKRDAIEAQDIRNEEIDVVLSNIEVVERWRDVKKKIFYVLMRMKK